MIEHNKIILKSLSHDLREPIRSIRRRLITMKESIEDFESGIPEDELNIIESNILLFGEEIKIYRDKVKDDEEHASDIFLNTKVRLNYRLAQFRNSVVKFGKIFRKELQSGLVFGNFMALEMQSRRLQAKYRSIIAFSEAGGKLEKRCFSLAKEIKRIANDLYELRSSKKGTVRIIGNSKILADRNKISLIFQNLLENSLNYCEKSPYVLVKISDVDRRDFSEFRRLDPTKAFGPGKYCIVRWKDNGVGVKREDFDKMFNPLIRGSGSRKLHDGGSGLGLAIASEVVLAHKGVIWIDSSSKLGSTFIVALPYR